MGLFRQSKIEFRRDDRDRGQAKRHSEATAYKIMSSDQVAPFLHLYNRISEVKGSDRKADEFIGIGRTSSGGGTTRYNLEKKKLRASTAQKILAAYRKLGEGE